jgi:hypothetical protein
MSCSFSGPNLICCINNASQSPLHLHRHCSRELMSDGVAVLCLPSGNLFFLRLSSRLLVCVARHQCSLEDCKHAELRLEWKSALSYLDYFGCSVNNRATVQYSSENATGIRPGRELFPFRCHKDHLDFLHIVTYDNMRRGVHQLISFGNDTILPVGSVEGTCYI